MQLLYAWLHLTNNNVRAFISIEEILDQTIFSNVQTRMTLSTPPTDISDKFTIGLFQKKYKQRGL